MLQQVRPVWVRRDLLKISDVAKKVGVAPSAIRYYERRGLIDAPARVSGHRDFSEHALVALQFVQLAQSAGFTIAGIGVLLEHWVQEPRPESLWKRFADTKRIEIRKRVAALQKMDDLLTRMLECPCQSLEACISKATQESAS
jgi:MerR family transcriptional regulator, redox-sensitive transcriptional activator SoxR